jgi:hypothetical protein
MPPTLPPFNANSLVPGQVYQVVVEFQDYTGQTHPAGETWRYVGKNFLPYEDGLTLWVEELGGPRRALQLQWRAETQAQIIDRFSEYVQALPGGPAYAAPPARPPHRRNRLLGWLATLLGIVVLIPAVVFLYILSQYRTPNTPYGANTGPASVNVEVVAPITVKTTDPFVVEVRLQNRTGQPQTLESIGFDTPYLEGSRLDRSDPPYERLSRMTLATEFFIYEFNRPIPAQGSLTLRFYLKSARPGDYSGQVMVCLNGARPCHVYPARTIVGN